MPDTSKLFAEVMLVLARQAERHDRIEQKVDQIMLDMSALKAGLSALSQDLSNLSSNFTAAVTDLKEAIDAQDQGAINDAVTQLSALDGQVKAMDTTAANIISTTTGASTGGGATGATGATGSGDTGATGDTGGATGDTGDTGGATGATGDTGGA